MPWPGCCARCAPASRVSFHAESQFAGNIEIGAAVPIGGDSKVRRARSVDGQTGGLRLEMPLDASELSALGFDSVRSSWNPLPTSNPMALTTCYKTGLLPGFYLWKASFLAFFAAFGLACLSALPVLAASQPPRSWV